MSDDRAELLAGIRAKAVIRGDFVLSSGRRADVYVDLRRVLLDGRLAPLAGRVMLDLTADLGYDAVGGLTLGADPVAYALVAAAHAAGRALDAFTVRKEPKTHGTGQRIEGCFMSGAAVVVVEDVITTGQSASDAIAAITAEGGRVLGVLAVVDREEGGRATLERAGHAVEALVTATSLGLR